MRIKTYKKSAAFWKHGKHKGLATIALVANREHESRDMRRSLLTDWKESVREVFTGLGKSARGRSSLGKAGQGKAWFS